MWADGPQKLKHKCMDLSGRMEASRQAFYILTLSECDWLLRFSDKITELKLAMFYK
jgi:hypothetical protein